VLEHAVMRHQPGFISANIHWSFDGQWKVERSHGWLDNWRRLVTRYDWYTESYLAFLTKDVLVGRLQLKNNFVSKRAVFEIPLLFSILAERTSFER
jgi:hypothetical protein